MESENKKTLLDYLNRNKRALKVAGVLFVLGIFLLSLGIILANRRTPTPTNAENVKKSGLYASVNIYDITDSFANYTVDNVIQDEYYMALSDNMIVILNMSKADYDSIISKMDAEGYDGSAITMRGMSEKMQTELKDLAVETFNEIFEDMPITVNDMNEYIVPFVINLKKAPNDNYVLFVSLGAIILVGGLISLICFGVFRLNNKKLVDKVASKYDIAQICNELSDINKLEIKGTNTVFLADYVISTSSPANVIKYSDVIWFYPHEQRVNGVRSSVCIFVETKEKKLFSIASNSGTGKKNTEAFDATYQEMVNRCPHALMGYSLDNVNAMTKQNIDNTIRSIEEAQQANNNM